MFLSILISVIREVFGLVFGLALLLLAALPLTIPVMGIVYICNKVGTFNLFIPLLGALIVSWLFFEERYWNPLMFQIGRLWDYYIRRKHDVSYPSGHFKKDGTEIVRWKKVSDYQRNRRFIRRFA